MYRGSHSLIPHILREHRLVYIPRQPTRTEHSARTYRKSLRQLLFASPPRLPSHIEKPHVTFCEVWPMMRIKYQHTSTRRQRVFTRPEQCAMLTTEPQSRSEAQSKVELLPPSD
jgi:hypothetical protein